MAMPSFLVWALTGVGLYAITREPARYWYFPDPAAPDDPTRGTVLDMFSQANQLVIEDLSLQSFGRPASEWDRQTKPIIPIDETAEADMRGWNLPGGWKPEYSPYA